MKLNKPLLTWMIAWDVTIIKTYIVFYAQGILSCRIPKKVEISTLKNGEIKQAHILVILPPISLEF